MSTKTVQENKFSTFGGVFTPSILTILGVIMFMRAGFVVGDGGVVNTLKILLVAKMITLLTTFSISAISTNMQVKGGGAYYLISRTLGAEFGGTIGLTLFLAQALSIPFYIIGFTEALGSSFPLVAQWQVPISFVTAVLIFALTYRGASDAIKVQYFILAVLGLSILSFFIGGLLDFSPEQLQANMAPREGADVLPFWALFAIYFPAVTGIMSGVNMSGDLKNPSRSIPLGTFMAIITGAVIYALQAIIMGGSIERMDLVQRPYASLMELSLWGFGLIVSLGVFAATLSSALGSFIGSPRILSALAVDKILKPLNPFSKLSKDGEPRRAIILSFVITLGVLAWAAGAGNSALNSVASVVSMFFLWTYGIINVAAFVESFGSNPSFRPRFKWFHWSLALLGAIGCLGAAFLIDPVASVGSAVLIALLLLYVRKTLLESSFGDARRGFYYSMVRNNLRKLNEVPDHNKNWRPTIILFSANPNTRLQLARFTHWLGSGRGIGILAHMVIGDTRDAVHFHKSAEAGLNEFCREENLNLFPQVIVTPQVTIGMHHLIQTSGIGELRPNLVMLGCPDYRANMESYIENLNLISALGKSVVVVHVATDWELPLRKEKKRIDIWWRGHRNGSLITILAWLLSLNSEWGRTSLRFLRLVSSEEEKREAQQEMQELIQAARIEAEAKIIVDTERDFFMHFREESSDATAIFMGFAIPSIKEKEQLSTRIQKLTEDMPPLFLVNSSGEADLLA